LSDFVENGDRMVALVRALVAVLAGKTALRDGRAALTPLERFSPPLDE
jgi:hypothetical protein